MKSLENERKILQSIPDAMLKTLYEFPKQFQTAGDTIKKLKLPFRKKFKNSLIIGMGSSTNVVYRLINSMDIDKINIPVFLCSRSTIPSWVNEETLIVAVTHSGNSGY